MKNYNQVRSLLCDIRPDVEFPDLPESASPVAIEDAWRSLWSTLAALLLQYLEAGKLREFDEAFPVVGEAVRVCDPAGRGPAVAALFGDFTRRAIASGLDRTRFADWFGPGGLFAAPPGRVRGRVLYFDAAKGRGKVLGADRTVYFVHFMMIQGAGYRSLDAGQLVEFTPQRGVINGRAGVAATFLVRLSEAGVELEG